MADDGEARHVIEVSQRADGRWARQRQGSNRAVSLHASQAEAITAARRQAQREHCLLVVRDMTGAVEYQQSFSSVASEDSIDDTPPGEDHKPTEEPGTHTTVSSAGWHPDPFQRYAQRYWDGAQWTEHVAGGTGTQSTDAPLSPTEAFMGASRRPPPAALVLCGVGTLLVLLSFFAFNWLEPSAAAKADVLEVADSNGLTTADEMAFGVTVGEFLDGISWTEIQSLHRASTRVGRPDGVAGLAGAYVEWGWYVALLAAATSAGAVFVPAIRRYSVAGAALVAIWQISCADDLAGETTTVAFGAWAGALGLVLVAAAPFIRAPSHHDVTAA
jgi:hypothetical protein